MLSDVIKYGLSFILLVLLQVLVLNHIVFLDYATPILYVYLLIKLPIGINRNLIVFLGFFIGLFIDIFSNTPGVNAAATTFVAFFRRPIQGLFFSREDFDQLVPKLSLLGSAFVKYTILFVLIHNILLFTIETFSYSDVLTLVLRIFSSAALTLIIIFGFEGFSIKRNKG